MFTPVQTLLGGVLLHIATSSLLTNNGRVFGISSVVDGAALGDHAKWRWAMVAGLVAGPAVAAAAGISGAFPDAGSWCWARHGVGRLALAGALVGFGSKLGSGCTSGHMLCGVSRLSPRSLIATCTFFLSAVITARVFPAAIEGPTPMYAATYPTTEQLPWLLGAVVAAMTLKDLVAGALQWYYKPATPAPVDTPASPAPDASSGLTPLQLLPYFVSGTTFSVGLAMSGMLSPLKVMGFLRLPPPLDRWDPSLAMVMLGGVLPNAVHWFALRAKTTTPRAAMPWEAWRVPTRAEIDWRLVVGAAVFGVGWGLCGICPGPAVTTLGQIAVGWFKGVDVSRDASLWAAFVGNMILGMAAVRQLDKVVA